MLETERLNKLFGLLEEMTQSKTSYPKFAPSPKMQRLQKCFMIGFLVTILVFLGLVAWRRFGTTPLGFDDTLRTVYSLHLVLGLFYLTTVTASAFHIIWRDRKQPFSPMLIALKNDLHRDAESITRLLTFDQATLAYGLLQYHHCWSSFDGRVAGLAGDLRKFGLFPALAAVSISAATLLKEDSNLFLWVPVTVAAIFYLVALFALVSRERPQQVIQLMEYAIRHADQRRTTPSDATHR